MKPTSQPNSTDKTEHTNMIAIETSDGHYWDSGELDFANGGYYVSEAINLAIELLSTSGGGEVKVYVQDSVISDSLRLKDHVKVDFCGNRCVLGSDLPLVVFSSCIGAALVNAKVYPLDEELEDGSVLRQSSSIFLFVATDGKVLRDNILSNIVVFPALSSRITKSCRYGECGDASYTYSWQEHVGIQFRHEGGGRIEFNTIEKMRIDGVKAIVEFVAADTSDSVARCNTIIDIHSNHCRSMVRFVTPTDADGVPNKSSYERHNYNTFEHIKAQGFCRAEYGVVGVSGIGNHFVACQLNDYHKAMHNPCRGFEYDISPSASETYIGIPFMQSLLNCPSDTVLIMPATGLLGRCGMHRTVADPYCQCCSNDCPANVGECWTGPGGAGVCPEPGNELCDQELDCLVDAPRPSCGRENEAGC